MDKKKKKKSPLWFLYCSTNVDLNFALCLVIVHFKYNVPVSSLQAALQINLLPMWLIVLLYITLSQLAKS